MTIIGISLGHPDDATAEHWLSTVPGLADLPGLVACTHLVRVPTPHVAISLAAPGGLPDGLPACAADFASAAEVVAAEHRQRRSGRAVRYPGVESLVGELSVAELLELSAIERVTLLGGVDPEPDTPVLTRDFVRPQWINGVLTLIAAPAGSGRIGPFELPDPTPCCADKH
ncbi:hypothetical protein [Micromonospora sp. NBC_01813]|uniref:hypothetical protein n=1 Tax=Micromonospora sp. NBC_01813 TaxID=2975988 RepID=UPI002DD9EFD8|nr:hypothetical protein [Micromonospora sp. NBC_01813]WSA09330.1 hypothetical protein OG958_00375 [Micromonospora sp. NBC_01813]